MEKEKPFFSIIIPCYNYGHFLDRALDSLQHQGDVNFEVLVIDDGSTDDSREVALKYTEQDLHVQYLFQNNAGPATARNHGVSKSRGEFIIFLDADDALESGVLTTIKTILSKNKEIECLIGGHTSIFTNGKIKHTPPPQLPSSAEECFIHYLEKKIRVCNGAMVIARHVFDSLSFPEELRSCEDIPFFAHLLLKYSCQSTDLTIARIYKHPDSLRHNQSAADKYRLMAVDKVFDSNIPTSIISLKKKFLAKAHLSLFRTLYLAGNFVDARKNYCEAIRLHPSHLLKSSYFFKYLRTYNFFQK